MISQRALNFPHWRGDRQQDCLPCNHRNARHERADLAVAARSQGLEVAMSEQGPDERQVAVMKERDCCFEMDSNIWCDRSIRLFICVRLLT